MSNHAIPFRPFELEIRSQAVMAGDFDGGRANVILSHVHNPIVSAHEAIHHRLSCGSTDGHILALYMMFVNGYGNVDSATRDAAEPRLVALMKDAIVPHEAAATYLGIKSFTPSHQDELIRQLPPQYREYYDIFARVLEPRILTSHLQWLFAWNIALLSFSSPFILKWINMDWMQPFTVPDHYRPSIRLHRIVNSIRDNTLGTLVQLCQSVANETCDALGITLFDIQTECGWERTNRVGAIQKAISTRLYLALVESAKIEYLRSDFDVSYPAEFELYRSKIKQRIGIDMLVLPIKSEEDELYVEAYQSAESVIANSNVPVPERADDDIVKKGFLYYPRHRVHVVRPTQSLGRWTLLFEWTEDKRRHCTISISDAAFSFWLRFHWRLKQQGLLTADVQTAVISVTNVRELCNMVYLLRPSSSRGASDRRWPEWVDTALCWYLEGNVFDWLAAFSKRRRVQIHGVFIRSDRRLAPLMPAYSEVAAETKNREVTEIASGLGAILLRIEGLPGLCLRMLSHSAFLVVMGQIGTNRTKYGNDFSPEDQRWASIMFEKASDAVLTFWERF